MNSFLRNGSLSRRAFLRGLGVCVALPVCVALGALARLTETQVLLPPWMLGATAALTMGMALASGLAALRSLRLVEPVTLLR